jgi:energy-coupling factor transporter ATP-binding protein EcfA2/energy-coupling factor transporter transmembrane protein EcfT
MPINIEDLTIEPILKSINCMLMDHTLTLIIGRSGSGKSTLLQAIAGLVRLGAGSVTYNDTLLWNKKKVNKEVLLQHSLAFQSPEHQLFAETVQEEFDYSLRPYRVSRVESTRRTNNALQELQLSQRILHYSPFELSGGQKRSVAVATLLATDSAWLLLDEPSAGLDARAAARLREQLAVWKQSKGILMATHDWEFFLPVADRILLMADGGLIANVTPAELMAVPSLLQQADIGVPDAIKVSCELQKMGIPMSMQLLSPEQMAEAIIDRLEGDHPPTYSSTAVDLKSICSPVVSKSLVEEQVTPQPRLYRIEPRLKWLIYMVLSVLILFQHQWSGLVFAIIVVFTALLLLRREHALQALRLCKPLLFFIVVASLFAGIEVFIEGGFRLSFDGYSWLLTVKRMLPFLAVTLLSFVFTLSTSTAEMKAGLEKALSIFERLHIPTTMLALAASLVLRFIPMILMEAERFSIIAAARGKRVVRRGQIRFRDIRVFTIPLLISLFQMVEDFILAMEIKGFKDKSKRKVK